MYKYILFDLDGTLTDPGMGITNSVAYALRKMGVEPPEREKLYPFIGPPLTESFMKYYGFSWEKANEAVECYREYFREKGIFENEVYSGVRETLSAMKKDGKTVILATSKPEEFALKILEHFDLIKHFDVVCGATMDGRISKKGDVIAEALIRSCVVDKSTAVMIGDRAQDIIGAKANGLDSIGVLFGYGDRKELEAAEATYIVEKVDDIAALL